jgi:hypothetical protein
LKTAAKFAFGNSQNITQADRCIFMFDGGNKRLRGVTNLWLVSNLSKTFMISTEMQQIGNKKVIHRRTREIICNTFDYMRITFPFEALTKTGFLRICFFNLFLNLPRHSLLRRLSEI